MAKREAVKNRKVGLMAMIVCACIGATMFGAGCGAARPVKYYQLTVPGDVSSTTDANTIPITLLVGPLMGSHLYRDDRIVYSSGDAMGMYDTHRWASPPTEMMQEVLFREFARVGKIQDREHAAEQRARRLHPDRTALRFQRGDGPGVCRASRGGIYVARYENGQHRVVALLFAG